MRPDRGELRFGTVTVIGVPIDGWGAEPPVAVTNAAAAAGLVCVAPRLRPAIATLVADSAEIVSIAGDLDATLDRIEVAVRAGCPVVVFATGDPGHFGIGRAVAERLGPGACRILPSPSAAATAFGRLGLPWDDAVVVSAHGRLLEDWITALAGRDKVAVLTAPDALPALVAKRIVEHGLSFEHAAVASDLGTDREWVATGDLAWLATTEASAMSVVLLWNGSGVADAPLVSTPPGAQRPAPAAAPAAAPAPAAAAANTAAAGNTGGEGSPAVFGLPEAGYAHRDGMITKAEVRAFCLARLALPGSGVLWDVGAGSGSLGIEAASLSPSCQVLAIERSAVDAARIRQNVEARSLANRVEVVEGEAPGCLAALPEPDRVFVGGGGVAVLQAAMARLRHGAPIVATFASIDRAVAAADLLGNLTQLAASRGVRLPDGTWRLVANDPVFVCWGRKGVRAEGSQR